MTPIIKTEVLNISRQPYSLLVGSKRVAKLRAGEKIELPYDIWSMTSALGKRSLETDIRKELIKVTTYVSTENSIIVISCDDKCKATTQIQPPEVKTAAENEKPNKLSVAKTATEEKAQKAVNPKNLELVSTEAHVRVAAKNSSVMQAVMGATTVDLNETETRVQQNASGFTPVEQVKSSSLFTRATQNIETESDNIMQMNTPAEDIKEESQTADTQIETSEETTQEENTVETSTESPEELSFEDTVAALIAEKDTDTLFKLLKDTYPGVPFTKTVLKKCKSLEEIVEKYKL